MVITLGSKGAVVINGEVVDTIEAMKVNAVDTTGAGDTFNAGLVKKISEGKDILESSIYASKAASLSVTKRGVINAIPTSSEVDMVMKNE